MLVAIPLGIGVGLSVPTVAIVAMGFNFLPAASISLVFRHAERSSGFLRVLTRFRSDRAKRVPDRFGFLGVVAVTPWLGVYAVCVTLELLGMGRRRILVSILVSLFIYKVVLATGFSAVFD